MVTASPPGRQYKKKQCSSLDRDQRLRLRPGEVSMKKPTQISHFFWVGRSWLLETGHRNTQHSRAACTGAEISPSHLLWLLADLLQWPQALGGGRGPSYTSTRLCMHISPSNFTALRKAYSSAKCLHLSLILSAPVLLVHRSMGSHTFIRGCRVCK